MEGTHANTLSERLLDSKPEEGGIPRATQPGPAGAGLLAAEAVPDDGADREIYSGGVRQEPRFRDAPFAIAFLIQFVAVLVVAFVLGVPALRGDFYSNDDTPEDSPNQSDSFGTLQLRGFLYLCLIGCCIAAALSVLSLSLMMKYASVIIKVSVLMTVAMSALILLLATVAGNLAGTLLGLLFVAVGLCYARSVWSRIPWASANLSTGVTAVKAHSGIVFVAFGLTVVSVLVSIFHVMAFAGVYAKTSTCTEVTDSDGESTYECQSSSGGILFLFLIFYYWTVQVIKNTIHVTVAGTVGTWWFDPVEGATSSCCCTKAVNESFGRSVTFSFGSICFGSLIVAILEALRQVVQNARRQNRSEGRNAGSAILLCLAECILSLIERLVEYFNQWAYIYVGLYGYDYITAGKNVMSLFRARGFNTIITDYMVSRALGLVAGVIGVTTGFVLLAISHLCRSIWFDDMGKGAVGMTSFLIGLMVGLVIASIMLGVVDSAVNTVLVCFAEAPEVLRDNHPAQSDEMRTAWRAMYPDLGLF